MIHIQKRTPPPELTTFRQAPDTSVDPPRRARYDSPGIEAVKPAMRAALVAEQRGVCCYCNDRIKATDAGMKIEHRVPQHGPHADATRTLDWRNLLGACRGEVSSLSGRGAKRLHCDSSKADQALILDPTDASHVATIGYTRGGRVVSSREEHQRALDTVLNLNDETLIERRRRALDALQEGLVSRYGARSFPAGKLDRLLRQILEPAADLRPFAGYLAWWLERALRKTSG